MTKTGEHIAGGSFIDPLLQQNPKMRDVRSDMREYLKQSNSQLMDSNVDIVMKCLSSNIDNRYGSCEELLPIVKIL